MDCQIRNLDNQNMEKLRQLSGMYRNMKEFTDALAFGTEGDLIGPAKNGTVTMRLL